MSPAALIYDVSAKSLRRPEIGLRRIIQNPLDRQGAWLDTDESLLTP